MDIETIDRILEHLAREIGRMSNRVNEEGWSSEELCARIAWLRLKREKLRSSEN
jgi:hypothetical protein